MQLIAEGNSKLASVSVEADFYLKSSLRFHVQVPSGGGAVAAGGASAGAAAGGAAPAEEKKEEKEEEKVRFVPRGYPCRRADPLVAGGIRRRHGLRFVRLDE